MSLGVKFRVIGNLVSGLESSMGIGTMREEASEQ